MSARAKSPSHAQFRRGDRVRYIGLSGRADGPEGVVQTVSKVGLRVRWDTGAIELVHPDDVVTS
jgi:hypothetical protein